MKSDTQELFYRITAVKILLKPKNSFQQKLVCQLLDDIELFLGEQDTYINKLEKTEETATSIKDTLAYLITQLHSL